MVAAISTKCDNILDICLTEITTSRKTEIKKQEVRKKGRTDLAALSLNYWEENKMGRPHKTQKGLRSLQDKLTAIKELKAPENEKFTWGNSISIQRHWEPVGKNRHFETTIGEKS